MLGAEKEIIANYVAAGQVRIIFWPMTDLGRTSAEAATAAYCAGEQSPLLFWELYTLLFEDTSTFRADRDYFIQQATAVGADRSAFATCFDAGEQMALVDELDQERRDMGILRRPTFDINGTQLFGSARYETFAEAIEAALP